MGPPTVFLLVCFEALTLQMGSPHASSWSISRQKLPQTRFLQGSGGFPGTSAKIKSPARFLWAGSFLQKLDGNPPRLGRVHRDPCKHSRGTPAGLRRVPGDPVKNETPYTLPLGRVHRNPRKNSRNPSKAGEAPQGPLSVKIEGIPCRGQEDPWGSL